MVKKIKQFRFYSTDNGNNNITSDELENGIDNYSIIHLGIQTVPGTKIHFNDRLENTAAIVGITGIYELDLDGTTGRITKIQINSDSMNVIKNIPTAYIIIDIIYESEEN